MGTYLTEQSRVVLCTEASTVMDVQTPDQVGRNRAEESKVDDNKRTASFG